MPPASARLSLFSVRVRWILALLSLPAILYAIAFSHPQKIHGVFVIGKIFTNRGFSSEVPAKLFHLIVYAILAFLLTSTMLAGNPTRSRRIAFYVIMALMIVVPEALQKFNSAHHPSLFDVAVDCLGMLLVMVGYWAVRRRRQPQPLYG